MGWSGKEIDFKDIGFSLNVPHGAVPYGELVMISVCCFFNGPFTLPEGLEFVSPVYCIHTTPVTQFRKPVELSLDHWARVEDESSCSRLSFVFAPFDLEDCQSPFEFETEDGGHFSTHFGVISVEHFSWVAIVRWLFHSLLPYRFVQEGECTTKVW